jgi:hypothetical protein
MATKARLDKMYLYPGSIAFFEDASPEEVQALADAVALGIAKLKEDGPRGWHMPEAFPGFVSAFEQLRDYIDLDPRVRGLPPKRLSSPSGRTFSVVFFANDEPG